MKNLIILFFVLFVGVAGFAVEGEPNDVFSVESACVDIEFAGGEVDLIQTLHSINVVITENEGGLGSVIVVDNYGKEAFSELFDGNVLIVVNKKSLGEGTYTLVAKTGTTARILRFVVEG